MGNYSFGGVMRAKREQLITLPPPLRFIKDLMLSYLKKNKAILENLMKLKGKYLDDFYQKNMI